MVKGKTASKTKVTKAKPAAKPSKAAAATKKTEQLKKDIKETQAEQEDDSFVLPSDSEDESGDIPLENSADESDAETDSEIAFQDDIITEEGKESSTTGTTNVANQSGHTIIKPSTQKGGDDNKSAFKADKNQRGVIYIGRLPSGFEEKELRTYFQQFGEITRLRLSRNKRTGASKHYAFIEFKESEVAKIAAETMNNYLLMGHLLKVSTLSPEQVHERMFIGANKKFKVIPYRKIEQVKHDKKRTREEWEKLNAEHLKRVEAKKEAFASKGLDYDVSDL